ncbi:uncharacterized protein GGS22DRAFT_200414, partial [Annulohypoxylon maeteangense]|uniref:uncharacterized protein n=1 Tax=Annulohypoxylon maeteangense TaxID=1927788 RepID=UPI0020077F22
VSCTAACPFIPTSSVEPRINTEDNNASEAQRDTYSINMAEAVFAASSLSLTLITTFIAILDYRARVRARAETHRQEPIGESRNPVNDEAGREACDALAQPSQTEETGASNETPLVTLPAVKAPTDPPPLPIPAERPSRS